MTDYLTLSDSTFTGLLVPEEVPSITLGITKGDPKNGEMVMRSIYII
jgi:hypothetical protein